MEKDGFGSRRLDQKKKCGSELDLMNYVEEIKSGDNVIAIVIRSGLEEKPLKFVSPNNFPLQVGVHNRERGTYIKPHEHPPYKNISIPSQEAFYIIRGKIEVELFENKKSFTKIVLNQGDSILINTAHALKLLEDTKMIEFKQGPYRDKDDKIYLED